MVKVKLVRNQDKVQVIVGAEIWCSRMRRMLPTTFEFGVEDERVQGLLKEQQLKDSLEIETDLYTLGYDYCDKVF